MPKDERFGNGMTTISMDETASTYSGRDANAYTLVEQALVADVQKPILRNSGFAQSHELIATIVNGKRKLPMAECLAIDLFRPTKNKVRSAQKKWASRCPVCSKEVRVRRQLKRLFPLKRKR